MKYSFIIPLYNTKISDIENCIKSIVNQDIKDYEIIAVNDGSTDIELNDYCEKNLKNRENIKYFFEKNSGSAVARNLGLRYVTGDYIVFVDADDELEFHFFKHISDIKMGEITVFDYCYVNNESNIRYSLNKNMNLYEYKNDIYANICFYPGMMQDFMFGSIWGKIFSTKFIKENKISFVSRLRKAQDRVFMLHSLGKTNDIKYYPELMYKYKLNKKSITHKMNLKMKEYYYYLYEEMMNFNIDNKLKENIRKFLSYNLLNELLLLTIFNLDYKKKYKEIRKELTDLLKKYNVNESISKIKYNEVPTKKGRIKIFLYKHKLYYLLYKVISFMQKRERKKLIK